MDLTPQSSNHGFTVISACALPEIDGDAYVMEHEVSGAKLLYLKNDDINKSFAIGFKTPPQDSTGVFHILEHSVLCGSKKFPVKEPFVNLLKGSMQTFLNALTFSDKTLYPVASTNEQDLFNLMDVYLDAVFHPQIYQKEAIFKQEGWHYEFAPTSDDASDETLIYNGVVYNEMKGALSDPSSVLYDHLQQALFPHTCYAFESGGDPKVIPSLTYQNYLDEHRRHYRTDNSFIILYGNLNIDRALSFLDTEYLTPVFQEQKQRDDACKTDGKPCYEPRTISLQPAVQAEFQTYEMNTAPENSCAGYGVVIGDYDQHERVVAVDILLDALLGSNEAPLKRALLDKGIAQDITVSTGDPVIQPFITIELRMPSEGAAETFATTLKQEAQALLDAGIDKTLIEAALSHAEFIMREHAYGMADGVVYAIQSLTGWLYGGDPVEYVRYEDLCADLRMQLTTDYFENLMQDLFCTPQHFASAEIVPIQQSEPDQQTVELADYQLTLTPTQKEAIKQDVAELRCIQETPDSPEALQTLPHLSIADLGIAPEEPPYGITDDAPIPCLYHRMSTHGIAYASQYFTLDSISFDDLPYLGVLNLVLGKLDTSNHTAAQIDTLTQAYLGNLSFYTEIFEDKTNTAVLKPFVVVNASALSKNIEHLASLPQEIMLHTRFDDANKILNILKQRKIELEQAFITAGHSCAAARARSYVVPAGVMAEQLSNVGFYQWICKLIDNYDNRKFELIDKLSTIAQLIFRDDSSVMSFAGSTEDYDTFWDAHPGCGKQGALPTQLVVPNPVIYHEAFVIPSDVSYTGLSWDRRLLNKQFDGRWFVATQALSYDYLWNEVRVKGGAYGVGFQAARKGTFNFYSYRDPHIDETIQHFQKASDWLQNLKLTEEELEGFIVATVASLDAPIKPRALIRRQDGDYFGGYSPEERLGIREEVIHTTTQDLHDFSQIVAVVTEKDARCTFGAAELIKNSELAWNAVNLIGSTE